MQVFRINRPCEDTIELFVGDKEVGILNHDLHGWDAMDSIQCLFERIAKQLGAEIVHTEVSE
jgi:hypothetical protein